jgi:zinc protease
MKNYSQFLKIRFVSGFVLFVLVASGALAVVRAQNLSQPTRRETLLNGLKLLVWNEKSPTVTVALRVHSGAAFDPKDKEGVMRLLADIMFPDEQLKLFFSEELGGSLNVQSNQDYIEIVATGSTENFERILDAVRNAAVNTQITPDIYKKVQAARLKQLQETNQNSAQIADAAVRKRLYGDFFPYSRPADGTAQSIAKIDHADLLLARERFLTSDNATLAIIGDVSPGYALRAVKQFFGGWRKADKPVPPTFRQPDAPDGKFVVVKLPNIENGQIRFAVRGLARNSAEYGAAQITAAILQERWRNALPEELKQNAFVRHEAHILPGILIFGASVSGGYAEPMADTAQKALTKILSESITAAEFDKAKSVVVNGLPVVQNTNLAAAETWFDADTFKLSAKTTRRETISAATLAQAQNVLAALQKQTPAAVAVTQAEGNAPAN